MKRALFAVAVAMVASVLVATPVAAQSVVRETSCTDTYGSNTMTYDCRFHVKDYTVGAPVTFTVNYSCTGACGPVLSFGLRDRGFTPAGTNGHLVGGRRIPGGLELTFAFDSLKSMGKGVTGQGHFKMNVNVDDGSGYMTAVPCNIDVHLNTE
jgi:hypothetical protein